MREEEGERKFIKREEEGERKFINAHNRCDKIRREERGERREKRAEMINQRVQSV